MTVRRRLTQAHQQVVTAAAVDDIHAEITAYNEPRARAGDSGVVSVAAVLAALVAVLAGLGALLLLHTSPTPPQSVSNNYSSSNSNSNSSSGKNSSGSTDAAWATLARAETYLDLVGEWAFVPLPDAAASRAYLRDHTHMSKHVSAFVQATFQALPLPSEELGYTYLVCAAGGPLVFDYFLGAVTSSLTVSPALRTLTRTFKYSTATRSVPDADVINTCGPAITMQQPEDSLSLPYSSKFETAITITEQWTSDSASASILDEEAVSTSTRNSGGASEDSRSSSSGSGNTPRHTGTGLSVHTSSKRNGSSATTRKRVSVKPFEQWTVSSVHMTARLTAERGVSDWAERYGQEHATSQVGAERWAALQAVARRPTEVLIGDVSVKCDLTHAHTARRCMYPATLFSGPLPGDEPLVDATVYLEWQDIKWGEEIEDDEVGAPQPQVPAQEQEQGQEQGQKREREWGKEQEQEQEQGQRQEQVQA